MERMISIFCLLQESLTDNRKDALYLRMWNEPSGRKGLFSMGEKSYNVRRHTSVIDEGSAG